MSENWLVRKTYILYQRKKTIYVVSENATHSSILLFVFCLFPPIFYSSFPFLPFFLVLCSLFLALPAQDGEKSGGVTSAEVSGREFWFPCSGSSDSASPLPHLKTLLLVVLHTIDSSVAFLRPSQDSMHLFILNSPWTLCPSTDTAQFSC